MRFVFKSFAITTGDPTAEMIRSTCPTAILASNIRLTELQWAADVLVYETVSTGLLEGTLTDRPVVVLCDRAMISFAPDALDLIAARAQIAFDDDELIAAVRAAVQGPLRVSADDRYRRAFGTHYDDGSAARRASDSTIALIQSWDSTGVA